jgi:Uncharacterized conserved protein
MSDWLVYGVDDGYFPSHFKGRKGKTILAIVEFVGLEIGRVDFSTITVDGEDASDTFLKMRGEGVALLDGVIYGGFNYIEPDSRSIVFYSVPPNVQEVERALSKHFPNDRRRANVILGVMRSLSKISTRQGDVFVYSPGISLPEIRKLLDFYQVFDRKPEPIRAAHVIASALSKYLLGLT